MWFKRWIRAAQSYLSDTVCAGVFLSASIVSPEIKRHHIRELLSREYNKASFVWHRRWHGAGARSSKKVDRIQSVRGMLVLVDSPVLDGFLHVWLLAPTVPLDLSGACFVLLQQRLPLLCRPPSSVSSPPAAGRKEEHQRATSAKTWHGNFSGKTSEAGLGLAWGSNPWADGRRDFGEGSGVWRFQHCTGVVWERKKMESRGGGELRDHDHAALTLQSWTCGGGAFSKHDCVHFWSQTGNTERVTTGTKTTITWLCQLLPTHQKVQAQNWEFQMLLSCYFITSLFCRTHVCGTRMPDLLGKMGHTQAQQIIPMSLSIWRI